MMEEVIRLEIVKKGSWLNRKYQVQTSSGQKLYDIENDFSAQKNIIRIKDRNAREIGCLTSSIPGFSFSYRAKLGDSAEEQIEIRHNFGKRIYEFKDEGLRCERRGFLETYDLFGENSRLGRIFAKAGRYILEIEQGERNMIPALFLFLTIKDCECAC